MKNDPPFISVVTTLYNSSPYLAEFHQRIRGALAEMTDQYEVIMVNDGSSDDSLYQARTLLDEDKNLKVIDLSRNFGHHPAMMTGIQAAKGDYVFLIDCDLEEAPELLPEFYQTLQKQGCDVVYGIQKERKGGLLERYSGQLYYTVVNLLCDTKLPHNLCTVRLMKRRYVDGLKQFTERELSIASVWQHAGFEQIAIPIKKLNKRTTSYRWHHKFVTLINTVTSFSSKPLALIFYTGLLILLVSGIWIVFLIGQYLFTDQPVDGWTSVIVSIWFFCGLTNFFIGIIGIYLSKIFTETKQRPQTLIKQIYE